MSRTLVTVVMLVAMVNGAGCAWLFQDRMRGGYDGRSEPQCTTSRGWVGVDGVLAGLSLLGVIAVAADERPIENRDALIASGVVDVLIHGASAISGATWASDCRRAYSEWTASSSGISAREEQERRRLALELSGNAQNDPRKARAFWCSRGTCVAEQAACGDGCSRRDTAWCAGGAHGFVCNETREGCLVARDRQRDWNMGECVKRRAELAHLPDEPPPATSSKESAPGPMPSAPPPPRGFFCSSSATMPPAGFCTREKADCQRARDAAIVAVTDLEECRLLETAFCHVVGRIERCAPTMETCVERMKSTTDITAECEERK